MFVGFTAWFTRPSTWRDDLPAAHAPLARRASSEQVYAMRTFLCAVLLSSLSSLAGEPVGEVSTALKLLGPNHKIVVEAYDDPMVEGVTCYVSRAKTGGIKGGLGLAEDKAEASISCVQVGPIVIRKKLPQQDEVFNERLSLVFKRLRIVRMVDSKHNTLVYLTYSDRFVDGSPKNSVTAIAVPVTTVIPVE